MQAIKNGPDFPENLEDAYRRGAALISNNSL